jgi:hypothetical protein
MATTNVNNTVYRKLDAQNGTSDTVRNGDCVLRSWFISNVASTARFVKLYNKINATSSDTPVATICIPATASANVGDMDWYFSTGLSVRCTTLVADNDNTAPTANDVIVHIGYSF